MSNYSILLPCGYGAASLFRVDSPAFEEREFELTRPQWVGQHHAPAGSKVKRESIPAKSCLVGPGSIYALNPCTEETARKAIEEGIHRPLILLSIPERAQLPEGGDVGPVVDAEYEDIGDDDPEQRCPACRRTLEECECF